MNKTVILVKTKVRVLERYSLENRMLPPRRKDLRLMVTVVLYLRTRSCVEYCGRMRRSVFKLLINFPKILK